MMGHKYSKSFLEKLELLFKEAGFIVRYEKGNFQSGYCLLHDKKVIVINKFFTMEGKTNCLLEIIKEIDIKLEELSLQSQKLIQKLAQKEIIF